MASLQGTNETVSNTEVRGGIIRVEAYLNLCEHETEEAGRPVYHGVIELIDARGGIDVSVQILPVMNEDESSHKGHFELTDDAKEFIAKEAARVASTLTTPDTGVAGREATDAEVVRAMWSAAAETEAQFRQPMGGLAALLASLVGDEDEDDFESDDDTSLFNPFSGKINPLGGLLN